MQKKELSKKLKEADQFYDITNYRAALGLYKQIANNDSAIEDLDFKIATCLYNIRSTRKEALPYFIKANNRGNKEALYYMGKLYHLAMDFDQATQSLKKYNFNPLKEQPTEDVERELKQIDYAKKIVRDPVQVDIVNLGKNINTNYPEYVPLISADEGTLIFTSRRQGSTGNLLDPNGEYFEDIYVSNKVNDEWGPAQKIPGNINTPTHDACVALSPDGQNLLTYRTSEDQLSGDIYISSFNGKDWSVPFKLDENINTKDALEASASFSADNNVLYYSSNREGGFGGMDIYRVVKVSENTWSKPLNLGAIINSGLDEDAPFIHPDGKTLYFSSKSHDNMGGYDIFRSTMDDKGIWSKPENIGYPINTVDDDIYFVLSVNGKSGYYSSNLPQGFGGQDLYEIKFPDERYDLVVLKADVLMEGGQSGQLNAKATFIDESNNKIQGIYKTNRSTGKFVAIVPEGKKYKVIVDADGYQSYVSDIIGAQQTVEIKLRKGN
jgi:hypothetical protein